jgi:hypothetical protein
MKTQIMAALVLLAGGSQIYAREKFERFEYFAPLPKRDDGSHTGYHTRTSTRTRRSHQAGMPLR